MSTVQRPIAALATLLCAAALVHAAPAAPVRSNHPILGTWTWSLPDGSCSETYIIRPDGTMSVSSGDEISQSAFTVDATPRPSGFYQWTDKVVKDNGGKDCAGGITKVGDTATTYLRFSEDGRRMAICFQESLERCIGPLHRPGGEQM